MLKEQSLKILVPSPFPLFWRGKYNISALRPVTETPPFSWIFFCTTTRMAAGGGCSFWSNSTFFAHGGSPHLSTHGWGKIGLRGGGGSLKPLSRTPPPLLGSRDGALKKVIDGANKAELALRGGGGGGGAAVVVFMSGQTETHSLGF